MKRKTVMKKIFHGINWADGRDNFVDGWVIPSGINHEAGEEAIANQSKLFLTQFVKLLGVNTIRLGINPATVLDLSWWPKYRVIIREATALNLNVILGCWESHSNRNGKIDDHYEFDRMWAQVLADYGQNTLLHFEIFNEPYGYSESEWREHAAAWIDRYSNKIRDGDHSRILVSGSGYNEDLCTVGTDPRFKDCKLSFHLYSWFGGKHKTITGWRNEIEKRIGPSNAARTIVTEWGASRRNRAGDYYLDCTRESEQELAYMCGMSDVIRRLNLGSVYWPGLRDGDDYSLTEREHSSTSLRITNESGKVQFQKSFGGEI